MDLILLSRHNRAARQLNLSVMVIATVVFLLLALAIGAAIGYSIAPSAQNAVSDSKLRELREQIKGQQVQIQEARVAADDQIGAMALKIGQLNANVIRLNALGQRLTGMAKLDDGEFDFNSQPAVGGPEELITDPATQHSTDSLIADIDSLDNLLYQQEQQLTVLEELMLNRKLQDRVMPTGRPVKSGWMSSFFGKRTDPFTGKVANHRGVDFAGKTGADIIAVAAGVVIWSGDRYGYGQMIEVKHANGYVTRYAHNDKNLVSMGDNVQKGQVIAEMGATGRATGPNLHFEVWHNGRPVNPVKYIKQST